MYVPECWTVSAHTRWLFLCLFPELRRNEWNKHNNNTRVSAETVRDENIYIIWFLTRHNVSMNDDKNDDFYKSSPRPTRSVFVVMASQSIADGVTITRQLWQLWGCKWVIWITVSIWIDLSKSTSSLDFSQSSLTEVLMAPADQAIDSIILNKNNIGESFTHSFNNYDELTKIFIKSNHLRIIHDGTLTTSTTWSPSTWKQMTSSNYRSTSDHLRRN